MNLSFIEIYKDSLQKQKCICNEGTKSYENIPFTDKLR